MIDLFVILLCEVCQKKCISCHCVAYQFQALDMVVVITKRRALEVTGCDPDIKKYSAVPRIF